MSTRFPQIDIDLLVAGTQVLERLDLDDSLIPNQHLAVPGSSELSYTSSLASAPERMMLLTTQGDCTLQLCGLKALRLLAGWLTRASSSTRDS